MLVNNIKKIEDDNTQQKHIFFVKIKKNKNRSIYFSGRIYLMTGVPKKRIYLMTKKESLGILFNSIKIAILKLQNELLYIGISTTFSYIASI